MTRQRRREGIEKAIASGDEYRMCSEIDGLLDETTLFADDIERVHQREQTTQQTVGRLIARLYAKGVIAGPDVIDILGL